MSPSIVPGISNSLYHFVTSFRKSYGSILGSSLVAENSVHEIASYANLLATNINASLSKVSIIRHNNMVRVTCVTSQSIVIVLDATLPVIYIKLAPTRIKTTVGIVSL